MEMKFKFIAAILLCGIISVQPLSSMTGSAAATVKTPEKECPACGHEKGEGHRQKAGMFRITDEEYVSWAEKYTPDKSAEWKEVLAERERLRKRWLSPEMAAKREAMQKEKEDRRKEIMELKKQYESGKITKEEYLKKAYEKMKVGMNHRMKGHALAINLKIAIEANNSREAALFLNEMLVFLKDHNDRLAKKMET